MSTKASSPPAPSPSVKHHGGEHRLRSENLAFDIDTWYPPLAKHTAPTVFLPLTRKEAQAIVAYYNVAIRHDYANHYQFTTSEVACLENLEARIDETLNANSTLHGGAFLRLCGRSPKDGEPTDPMARAEIWEIYQRNLRQVMSEEETSLNRNDKNPDSTGIRDNARVVAIARTASHTLRVQTGADAMALLLTSERVFSDMLDWLYYGEPEQIVLRAWQGDAYDVSTEFRVFVRHGKMIGISQYEVFARHIYLQDAETRSIIIQAILEEWLQLKDCVETIDGCYCADFGVDMNRTKAHFIELSPFRRCTGPALFAWKDNDGKDSLVVPDRPDVLDDSLHRVVGYNKTPHHIAAAGVLRVRTEIIPQIGDLVDHNWDWKWSTHRVDKPSPFRDVYAAAAIRPREKMSLVSRIWSWLFPPQQDHSLLFVYGTLKRNCHWNAKYMTGAHFVGTATTSEPQSLVIGQCGVPYMIDTANGTDDGAQAKPVRGELWKVSREKLQSIDEYEGISKDHYFRTEIAVTPDSQPQSTVKASCYFYAIKPGASDVDEFLQKAPRVTEYSVEEQQKQYKPIHHIQVKQLQYLGEEVNTS